MANSIPIKGEADKEIGAQFAPLAVSAQNVPNLTVNVRAGSFWNADGVVVEFAGGNTIAIAPPGALNRWSLVSLSSVGSLVVTHGVASAAPSIPAPPAGNLPLAAIYLASGATAITNANICDVRPYVQVNGIPNTIAVELADRPTITDMNNALALKADVDGTTNSVFSLSKGAVGPANASLVVDRGASVDVGIRWNEVAGKWQFTNDGSTWVDMAATSGVFMPLVPTAVSGDVATFDALGAVQDSGTLLSSLATTASVALKADKVVGAVAGNFAGLNGSGNLTDSGYTPASFVTPATLTAGLALKASLTGATFTGNVVIDTTLTNAMTLGNVGGPADSGISIDRGVDPAAKLYFDEVSNSWVAGVVGDVGTILTEANAVLSVNSVLPVLGNVTLTPASIGAVPTTRNVNTSAGELTGGGALSADLTLGLANTTVAAGSYGSASSVATFTVDAKGRLTAAANATIAIPQSAVTNLTTDLGLKLDEITAVDGNIATWASTGAALADSGVAPSSLAPKASPVFTGYPQLPVVSKTTLNLGSGNAAQPVGSVLFVTDDASLPNFVMAYVGADVTWRRIDSNSPVS